MRDSMDGYIFRDDLISGNPQDHFSSSALALQAIT
jgi:hypothetical protein